MIVFFNSISNSKDTIKTKPHDEAKNYIKEYFGMKGEKSNAYMFASSTINAPNDTKVALEI